MLMGVDCGHPQGGQSLVAKQDIWATPIWTPAPETLTVIIPASILSKHYFNQSKHYLKSHHFHQ